MSLPLLQRKIAGLRLITTADIIVMFLEEHGVSVKKVTKFGTDRYKINVKDPRIHRSNVSVYVFPNGHIQGSSEWSLGPLRTNIHNPDSLELVLRYVTTPHTAKDYFVQ